jgi:S-adenosylmethionine decarboxylase
MNLIEGPTLSTIHVTPEDGFGYASFEAMGYDPKDCDLQSLLDRVLSCFRLMIFSIAVHVNAGMRESSWTKPVWPQGYTCEMISERELTWKNSIVYYTYRMRNTESPRSIVPSLSWEEESEENNYLQVKENQKNCIGCKDLQVCTH